MIESKVNIGHAIRRRDSPIKGNIVIFNDEGNIMVKGCANIEYGCQYINITISEDKGYADYSNAYCFNLRTDDCEDWDVMTGKVEQLTVSGTNARLYPIISDAIDNRVYCIKLSKQEYEAE